MRSFTILPEPAAPLDVIGLAKRGETATGGAARIGGAASKIKLVVVKIMLGGF